MIVIFLSMNKLHVDQLVFDKDSNKSAFVISVSGIGSHAEPPKY